MIENLTDLNWALCISALDDCIDAIDDELRFLAAAGINLIEIKVALLDRVEI